LPDAIPCQHNSVIAVQNYAFIIACVIVVAIGQLAFKTVGTRLGGRGFEALLTDHSTAAMFMLAMAAYGIATFGWVLALRNVPLSTAYLFMSANFILVPMMAFFILGEPVSGRVLIGGALIVSGIIVAATAGA
jgi:drug/metabolite transporter (DMT)-like permease